MAQVNQAEINKLNEEANASKQQASMLSTNNYNYNQAVTYQNSADQLADEAKKLREEADDEKDPVQKAKLLEKATSSENTAIAYYQKSNKLYSEAIVENFSDDKLTLAKTVQGNNEKQSDQLTLCLMHLPIRLLIIEISLRSSEMNQQTCLKKTEQRL